MWILSEADLISTLPVKGILESSLRFQLYEFSDPDFNEYLKDLSVRERNNGTFPEWNYSASEIWKLLKNKKCVHHRIEQCSNDFIKDIYSSFIPCILDAVYALAHATDIYQLEILPQAIQVIGTNRLSQIAWGCRRTLRESVLTD